MKILQNGSALYLLAAWRTDSVYLVVQKQNSRELTLSQPKVKYTIQKYTIQIQHATTQNGFCEFIIISQRTTVNGDTDTPRSQWRMATFDLLNQNPWTNVIRFNRLCNAAQIERYRVHSKNIIYKNILTCTNYKHNKSRHTSLRPRYKLSFQIWFFKSVHEGFWPNTWNILHNLLWFSKYIFIYSVYSWTHLKVIAILVLMWKRMNLFLG